MWKSLALVLSILVQPGLSCLGGGGGAPGTTVAPGVTNAPVTAGPGQPQQSQGGALDQLGGVNQLGAGDSGGYDQNGGVATDPSQLNCDFSGPCCWHNDQPPKDQLDWLTGSGFNNPTAFSNFMGGKQPPTGKVLILAAGPTVLTDRGDYSSCALKCAENAKVTLNYWMSSGTSLQVCLQSPTDPAGTLLNCQPLLQAGSPGPVTLTGFPPIQNQQFVISASGFGQPGAVIVSNIVVTGDSKTGSCATANDGGACAAAACPFTSGMCSYQSAPPPAGSNAPAGASGGNPEDSDWTVASGRKDNALTGVRDNPKNGNGYVYTYLLPKEGSTLASGTFNLQNPVVLSFDYLEQTSQEALELHLDNPSSPPVWQTPPLTADSRGWHHQNVALPAGTKQVFWVAKNTGSNQGAAAVSNVDVLSPGPDPANPANNPGGSLCGPHRSF